MKILLVEPPACSPLEKAVMGFALTEPLALELAAAGLASNHDVRLLDMRIEEDGLANTLLDYGPDLVATSAYTATRNAAIRILAQAKEHSPDVTTVIGGHHVTLAPDDFATPVVDFAVLGEGEVTFSELVKSLDIGGAGEDVLGVGVPMGKGMALNRRRPLADLDALPLPLRSLKARYHGAYFRGRWRPVASSYTSRGCPFRCRFCAMWKLYDGVYRMRSPEKVAEEVAALSEPYVDFADDNTIQDPNQSEALARALSSIRPRKAYKAYARADAVVRRPDLVGLWRDAGLELALIGFEAFRDEDLRRVRKGATLATNEKALEILRAQGVDVVAYFLVYPDFTREDFRALSIYIEEKEVSEPVFTVLTPFPGTDYYEEERGNLTTNDLQEFDLMHSVLPTQLPIEAFQEEFAGLYRRAYGPGGPAEGRFPPEVLNALYTHQTRGTVGKRSEKETPGESGDSKPGEGYAVIEKGSNHESSPRFPSQQE
ncbi:MAG: B12-binding domain-containing radical SAM protein [Planctomycetota bacterium]